MHSVNFCPALSQFLLGSYSLMAVLLCCSLSPHLHCLFFNLPTNVL